MVGTQYSGNPNIIQDLEGKRTGPKTETGKLKTAMRGLQNGARSKKLDKVLEELGFKFKKTSEAITLKKSFITWWKSKTGKELSAIDKLEEVITLLEADTSVRVMKKLEKGIPLDEDDVKIIRLLKDCLSTVHELKFGKKQLNVHASYDDIRKMMFDDNPRSK